MGKFAKLILIAAVIIVLLYALAVLAANLYLQSRDVQKRIHIAVSDAVGTSVEIHSTYYIPWSGLVVSGIKVPYHPETGLPLVEINSVHFHFAFLPLLQGQLVIREVLLSHPTLTFLKKEQVAFSPPLSGLVSHSQTLSAPETSPSAASGISQEITMDTKSSIPSSSKLPTKIEQVRIRHGRALFFNEKEQLFASLEDLTLNATPLPKGSVTGDFKIQETHFVNFLHPHDIQGQFSWADGKFTMTNIIAKWAGGKLLGTFEWESHAQERFTLAFTADSISLKKLVTDAGMNGEGTKGKLFAEGKVLGQAQDPESISGNVEVSLQKARLQTLEVFQQIGELLQIEELQRLRFKTAEALFTIRDEKVIADKILLESENLIIDATGPTSFGGKLKLRAHLHINEKLSRNFRGIIGSNFEPSDREGYYRMPFSITGTLEHPKTDLLDRLIGIKISQDVGGLLKGFFRSAPPEEQDKPEQIPVTNESAR